MSDEAPPIPDLLTDRLRLRALEMADAPSLHLAYGSAHAMRFWDSLPSRDLAETEARLSRSLSASTEWHAAWAVLDRGRGQFIGMVNYHARQAWNRRLAAGWILVPDCERRGYMQEAMLAFLAYCFDSLDTHRVEAEIEPANARSARLAERLGFQREGLLRDRLDVAGEPRSCWMYSLLRQEWKRP
jgi:ribosomal-protein-alanine N-acetyltransferase